MRVRGGDWRLRWLKLRKSIATRPTGLVGVDEEPFKTPEKLSFRYGENPLGLETLYVAQAGR